ncbi:hypothetical protein PENTCL1PPCAC_8992 [Pristionchus entomophagus]|uniref:Phlebovirus glycoprotein G2 fusion domain-containing protein n=1 Tax=Pristionchus entomophagus TaxID=358040 RepID=A0AAV5STY9_9BILA|nr:hypothetical protein PENTCL1PPCAC_8992 [Pristionchus entomophagus]
MIILNLIIMVSIILLAGAKVTSYLKPSYYYRGNFLSALSIGTFKVEYYHSHDSVTHVCSGETTTYAWFYTKKCLELIINDPPLLYNISLSQAPVLVTNMDLRSQMLNKASTLLMKRLEAMSEATEECELNSCCYPLACSCPNLRPTQISFKRKRLRNEVARILYEAKYTQP